MPIESDSAKRGDRSSTVARLGSVKGWLIGIALLIAGICLLRFQRNSQAVRLLESPYFLRSWHSQLPITGQNVTNKQLRILPLGDSITEGYGSSSGDGYRAILFDHLTQNGNAVTMIGSRKSGNMLQNSHDGWGGFTILKVASMNAAWAMRPNVILLLAGINDAALDEDIPHAAQRLNDLVGALSAACPDAAILVGTLTPCLRPIAKVNARIINTNLEQLIAIRVQHNQHILLVDLSHDFDVERDLADDLHPNDSGYRRIAYAWADALNRAEAAGWIHAPVDAPTRPAEYALPWSIGGK